MRKSQSSWGLSRWGAQKVLGQYQLCLLREGEWALTLYCSSIASSGSSCSMTSESIALSGGLVLRTLALRLSRPCPAPSKSLQYQSDQYNDGQGKDGQVTDDQVQQGVQNSIASWITSGFDLGMIVSLISVPAYCTGNSTGTCWHLVSSRASCC